MSARLLCIGDVHLGRRPARLPEDLAEHGVDASALTPAAAWREAVRLAREEGADAVVLSGDVVESLEDRFEAYAHLAAGVWELVEAGVPVFGVAGNHDVYALPRLAEQIPRFRLLGRGGRWESETLRARDGTTLRLLGWSFPAAVVRESPLASLRCEASPGAATVAVLHCDLDAGRSPYAPVARSALEAAPVDAWLLGHVHRPSLSEGPRPVGYLGSLVGLDPGEPGLRGPWWVEVEGPGLVSARSVPLAPLRWEREDVPLDALDTGRGEGGEASEPHEERERLRDLLFAALRQAVARIGARIGEESAALGGAPGRLRAVGCRLRLVGRSRHHRALRPFLADPTLWPREQLDGVHYFVEKLEDAAGPALDLASLARGSDPPSLLARRLLALERGGAEAEALVAAAARRLEPGATGALWSALDAEAPDREAVRACLVRAGVRALEDLLAQRESGEPAAPVQSSLAWEGPA